MSQVPSVPLPTSGGLSYGHSCLPAKNEADARWFSEEIQPHEPALRAYLRARFPTLQDVDDQIQETYARLFRAKENGRHGLNRAYLFVIARNAALDIFRRRKALPLVRLTDIDPLALAADQPVHTADDLDRQREFALLAAAVESLPERCREIFTLRRFHDWSHQEIAQALGVSENTVNAQLVIGMTRCRQFLRARHVRRPEEDHTRA